MMSRKFEQFVRASIIFENFCSTMFAQLAFKLHTTENLDPSSGLPILKLTLAIPLLFKSFQARFFDRAGERGTDISLADPLIHQLWMTLWVSRECDEGIDKSASIHFPSRRAPCWSPAASKVPKDTYAWSFLHTGIHIGCPSYQEAVKALLECDANKDRMISRDEFDEVAIRLLSFAAVCGTHSFINLYTTGILVRNLSP